MCPVVRCTQPGLECTIACHEIQQLYSLYIFGVLATGNTGLTESRHGCNNSRTGGPGDMSASVTAWKILEESVGRYQSLFMAYLSIMTNVFAFTEWTLQAILGTGCWKRAILGRASLSLESGPDSAFYWFLLWTLDGRPCSELMSSSADKINTQNSGCVTVLLLLYFKWTKWIKHINTNTLSNRVEEWTWGQYPTYFIYL